MLCLLLFAYCLHVACKKGAGKGFVWSTGDDVRSDSDGLLHIGKEAAVHNRLSSASMRTY